MQRLTRITPPIQRTPRSLAVRPLSIPHAGPSTLPLSTRHFTSSSNTPENAQTAAPFSALRRPQRFTLPYGSFHPSADRPGSMKTRTEDVVKGVPVERYEATMPDTNTAGKGRGRTKTPGRASAGAEKMDGGENVARLEREADEALAEVSKEQKEFDEFVNEEVEEDVEEREETEGEAGAEGSKGSKGKEGRTRETRSVNLYERGRIDEALRPFEKPIIPRKILPGEPILLPLSNLGALDPSAPSASGVAVSLPTNIFNALVRRDILHTCAVWFRATMRRGTVKTLGRSEVAFSGKKIRPQKKTGKARLGHRGSPMLRKGGHAHPLRPRDWSYNLPRKIRALGMRMALSSKLYMNNLRVVESLNEAQWTATSQAARALTSGKRLDPSKYRYTGEDEREARELERLEKEKKLAEPATMRRLKQLESMDDWARLKVLARMARRNEPVLARLDELPKDSEELDALVKAAMVVAEGLGQRSRGGRPISKWMSRRRIQSEAKKQLAMAQTAEASRPAEAEVEAANESLEEGEVEAANELLEEGEGEGEASSEVQDEGEEQEAGPTYDQVAEFSKGFGKAKDLSILFLYPPGKPAQDVWEFARVVRNIPGIEIMSTDEVEVYHILKYQWLVMEGGAVDSIAELAGQVRPRLPELGVSAPTESDSASAGVTDIVAQKTTTLPRTWVLDKWRKDRGSKSLIRTFGLRNANIQKELAKRAWMKIRREGKYATPDGVAREIHMRMVGGVKALGSIRTKIGGGVER